MSMISSLLCIKQFLKMMVYRISTDTCVKSIWTWTRYTTPIMQVQKHQSIRGILSLIESKLKRPSLAELLPIRLRAEKWTLTPQLLIKLRPKALPIPVLARVTTTVTLLMKVMKIVVGLIVSKAALSSSPKARLKHQHWTKSLVRALLE